MVAIICGGFLLPAAPSGAQVNLPPHSLERSGDGCLVTLLPEATFGDGPRLAVRSRGGRSDMIQFGIVAPDGVRSVQMVSRNTREPFADTPMQSATRIERSAIWRSLDSLARAELPFHLTAQTPSGEWISSRYEAMAPLEIIRILETNDCYASAQVTARTTQELLADERALGLSADDIRHIRWVLASQTGAVMRTPVPLNGGTMTAGDRRNLMRFTERAGMTPSQYLTQVTAARLLAMPFTPRRRELDRGATRVQRDRDWVSYLAPVSGGTASLCVVQSDAVAVEGDAVWVYPAFVLASRTDWTGDSIWIRIVTPNPFAVGRQVTGIVDGRRYTLQIDGGEVKPRATGGNTVSEDFFRAVRRGEDVAILGTSAETGRPLTVRFSAFGFTAAFSRMANLCGRSALLSWIN